MIRIALIGCENATADYGQLARRLQGARLAAVVDPRDNVARRTAEALVKVGQNVPLWATSFENLLRDNADAFDAVVIRRPCSSPQAVVAQAAATGKHVMLDMSLLLGMPPDDVSIVACRSAGVTFMLSQATRFLPSVAEVKSCLGSGVLGTPGLLRIHDFRPPDADEPSYIPGSQAPAWEPTDSEVRSGPTPVPKPELGNQKERELGNQKGTDATAAILQAVLPDLDLANWIFDALPTEVYAAGHAAAEDTPGSYGYLQVHLGYTDGGMALLDYSMMLPPGSDYFSLSVFGSAGAAYADDHHNMHLQYRGGRPTALPASQGRLHYLAELQEFVDAIETGRPPAITADDGHRAAEVVRAACRSLKSGRAMQLVGSCYEFV